MITCKLEYLTHDPSIRIFLPLKLIERNQVESEPRAHIVVYFEQHVKHQMFMFDSIGFISNVNVWAQWFTAFVLYFDSCSWQKLQGYNQPNETWEHFLSPIFPTSQELWEMSWQIERESMLQEYRIIGIYLKWILVKKNNVVHMKLNG